MTNPNPVDKNNHNLAFRYGRESSHYMDNLLKAVTAVCSLIERDREPAESFTDYVIDTFTEEQVIEALEAVAQLDRIRKRLGMYCHSRKAVLDQRNATFIRAAKKLERQLEENDPTSD